MQLTPALLGDTRLFGLCDNEFTWQHRAKNIWTALKITNKKREGERGPSHTYLCRPLDGATVLRQEEGLYHTKRITKRLSETDSRAVKDKHTDR